MPERLRFNLISEITEGRPIHMFRPGTFTDMHGRESTFTTEDVSSIISHFRAGKRPKPPITESHDYGRAVGRVMDVWADGAGNLFGKPKWNPAGKQLLSDEVYDGFSIEIVDEGAGWMMIGGSLTNYPAVSGLQPVMLSAPPEQPYSTGDSDVIHEGSPLTITPTTSSFGSLAHLGPAPSDEDIAEMRRDMFGGAIPVEDPITLTLGNYTPENNHETVVVMPLGTPADAAPSVANTPVHPTTEVLPMSDPIETSPLTDVATQAQIDTFLAQANARNEAVRQADIARIQADFERRIHDMEQRSRIEAFSRNRTVTTPDQPFALPMSADDLSTLLLETPAAARGKWMSFLTKLTTTGLLTFDEIGSSGQSAEGADQYAALVAARQAQGLSRVEAIKAVGRSHPDLFQSQTYRKGGR